MTYKDLIRYGESLGVVVNPLVARKWLKGGTAAVKIVLASCEQWLDKGDDEEFPSATVVNVVKYGNDFQIPEIEKNSTPPPKEKKANFVPAPVHDIGPHSTLRPMGEFVPVVPNPDEKSPVKAPVRRKSSSKIVEDTPESDAIKKFQEKIGGVGIITNENGWNIRLPEKRVVETEVKFIEPIEVGRAESVPNGWKFDPVLRKTGFIWNEVVYSHKGFLEVGTLVRLDGETVELEIQGFLKLISE